MRHYIAITKRNHGLNNPNEILKLVVQGDQKAFRALYEIFSAKVYNVALSYTKNVEDAEEITQDVFTKIYKNAASFKGNSALSTWIYRITINSSLNLIKKRNRFSFVKTGLASTEPPTFDHPGILLENKENARILFQVIDTLSENQKTVFILSYIEELPRQEIADIMALSLKAVESLLQRAKGNLRKKLEDVYPNRRKSKSKWSKGYRLKN